MSDRYTVASARRALAKLAITLGMVDDLYLDVYSHPDTGSRCRAVQTSTGKTVLGSTYMSPREAYKAFQLAETTLAFVTVRAFGVSRVDAMMQERIRTIPGRANAVQPMRSGSTDHPGQGH